jgi:hypothetical protein
MMGIELKETRLVSQIEQLAAERTRPATQILEMAVQAYLDKVEQESIHAETEAFWAMHDELVAHYEGEYVAIYKGQIVDHDSDVTQLQNRILGHWGTLPVLIAPVKAGPRQDLVWRGGRLER